MQEKENNHLENNFDGAVGGKDVSFTSEPNTSYYHETIKTKKKEGTGSFKRFVVGLLILSSVGGTSIGAGFALTLPFARQLVDKETIESPEKLLDIQGAALAGGIPKVQPVTANGTIADIAANVGPSVVSIVNNQTVMTWAGEFNQSGLGSGVVFKEDDKKVYIITNAHVVQNASNLVVTFLGNYKVPATIVGMDTVTDIAAVAVLKEDIPKEAKAGMRIAALGDNETLNVGDLAVAIGTPIKEAYNNTVTVGVISALDRQISLTDKTLNLIQTDAAINPGNSGGALVGPTGEVIGINTVKLVQDQIEGMGFAIPINDVKPIVDELMTQGHIARPSLGIIGENMTENLGLYEIPVGVIVREVVPGSSADIAGLKSKDIILEFDGQKLATMEELKEILRGKKINDTVTFKIIRGSSKKMMKAKLQEMPTAYAVQQ